MSTNAEPRGYAAVTTTHDHDHGAATLACDDFACVLTSELRGLAPGSVTTGGGRDDVARVVVDISMSLDGFIAGPGDGLGRGLGEGGEPIHNWIMGGHWTYDGGTPFQAAGVDREFIDEMFPGPGRSS
jgi:hypothetical protein